ncbi:hypothetical protein Syun_003443 [Stephania yunnanensis]|uniref:Uncharacterized protein n=1 Tax=Stephania yunnanensis TaxID=152371 RepID=A0AAP0L1F8_9MAGN
MVKFTISVQGGLIDLVAAIIGLTSKVVHNPKVGRLRRGSLLKRKANEYYLVKRESNVGDYLDSKVEAIANDVTGQGCISNVSALYVQLECQVHDVLHYGQLDQMGTKPLINLEKDADGVAQALKRNFSLMHKDKQYQKAISFYTEAIKLNGKNATYYGNRAAAYLELERYYCFL